jgi:hypothetical protein
MRKLYYKKKGEIQISRADFWFSRYIRIRDSFNSGYNQCCTCGKISNWKDFHCGHFVPRNRPSCRFKEENAHPQCENCNVAGNGEQAKHAMYIEKRYGQGMAQWLLNYGDIRGQKQFSPESIRILSDIYRVKAKTIAKMKGLKI